MLFRAMHESVHILFIFEMRKVTYLCYFAHEKILQPYIHGYWHYSVAQNIIFL